MTRNVFLFIFCDVLQSQCTNPEILLLNLLFIIFLHYFVLDCFINFMLDRLLLVY